MSKGTCSAKNCDDPVKGRGWCSLHYGRWLATGAPGEDEPRKLARHVPGQICKDDDCSSPVKARGWCSMHWTRWYETGDTRPGEPRRIVGDDKARILSHIDQNGPIPEYAPHLGPCWIWLLYTNSLGYGSSSIGGRTRSAYVATYELFVGPVPEGLELDHLCRVPSCCNPAHLEPVTHAENLRRGIKRGFPAVNAAKTHCPQDHPYDGDNLVIEPSTGRRRCRICTIATRRRAAEKKRRG